MAAMAVAESSAPAAQVGGGLRHSDDRLLRDRVCQRPQFWLFRVGIISNDSSGSLFGDRDRVNERSGRPIRVRLAKHYSNSVEDIIRTLNISSVQKPIIAGNLRIVAETPLQNARSL